MRTMLRTSAIAVLLSLPMLLSAQTARTVLLEQFTGTWCQWCPYGADEIDSILTIFPNAASLAYHNADPMETTETQAIDDHLLVTGYPTGAIDRRLWTINSVTSFAISRGYWRAAVGVRDTVASNMSINVTGTFNQDTRLIDGTVTLNILNDYSGEFYLNIVVSESGLNYAQKKNVGGSIITINPYYHKRVVRKLITPWPGDQLTTTGFTKNQIVTYPFTYTMPSGWDVSNCDLTVFVTQRVVLTVNGQPTNKSMNLQQAWQKPLLTAVTPVPVELVSFNASQVDGSVRLDWRTASENNNSGWFVQRRIDGDWDELGFVDGYGTTNEQQKYEFVDRMAPMNAVIDYRLRQVDFDGSVEYSPISRVRTAAMPTTTRLHPNYPNPFNPATSIMVELSQEAQMHVEIIDMLGRRIRTLADGIHSAGRHVLEWNGTDESGAAVQSGIYFARLTTQGHTETIQMQLAK